MDAIVLLLLFGLKHFIADYVVQKYLENVYDKREDGWKGVLGITNHAMEHGALTLVVVCIASTFKLVQLSYWWLAVPYIDFASHFVIDFTKIQVEKSLRLKWLWSDFGIGKVPLKKTLLVLDQTAHISVYLFLIYILLA
jgi:hypothetical protein